MAGFDEELAQLASQGLQRTLFLQAGKSIVNFSSNDYLGLSQDPDVKRAAIHALEKYGTGGTSSRLLAGTFPPHQELEQDLARFLSKEAALVFSSGYHANTGIIPALVSSSDVVFFDRLSHASIIDGVRLSGATFSSFDHNDPTDLERRLKKVRAKGRRALVITEGIFSMDGDQPPLLEIVRLAKEEQALVYLDEAHSLGVIGPGGRGIAAEMGCLDRIDVHVGTLSKALGSQGGFVAGSKTLIDLLISRCRSFLYTTALAPALAASARKALELLPRLQDRRVKILGEAEKLRKKLCEAGYDCLQSRSQIVPVLTGEVHATKKLSDRLLSQGFFVPSVRPPTVSAGKSRVRLSISYPVVDQLDALFKAFEGVKIVQTA